LHFTVSWVSAVIIKTTDARKNADNMERTKQRTVSLVNGPPPKGGMPEVTKASDTVLGISQNLKGKNNNTESNMGRPGTEWASPTIEGIFASLSRQWLEDDSTDIQGLLSSAQELLKGVNYEAWSQPAFIVSAPQTTMDTLESEILTEARKLVQPLIYDWVNENLNEIRSGLQSIQQGRLKVYRRTFLVPSFNAMFVFEIAHCQLLLFWLFGFSACYASLIALEAHPIDSKSKSR
jgi:hypothetical protein